MNTLSTVSESAVCLLARSLIAPAHVSLQGPSVVTNPCSASQTGRGVVFDAGLSADISGRPLAAIVWALQTGTDSILTSAINTLNAKISPRCEQFLLWQASSAHATPTMNLLFYNVCFTQVCTSFFLWVFCRVT